VDKPKPGWLTVSCTATHVQGHSETEKFELPLGTAQFMTAQQEVGAARTFGSRYCFLGVFGIMTGDEDTDANPPEEETPAPQKQNTTHTSPTTQAKPAATSAPQPQAQTNGSLTAKGEIANVEDFPMKAKPGKFRYKITLIGQEKPFYSFDTKIRDLCHEHSSKTANITYTIGKYGQDITSLTFDGVPLEGEVLDTYNGELEAK
jgi:hypothetical protein